MQNNYTTYMMIIMFYNKIEIVRSIIFLFLFYKDAPKQLGLRLVHKVPRPLK